MALSFKSAGPQRIGSRSSSKHAQATRPGRTLCRAVAQLSPQSEGSKTVVVRNKPGDLPFPWSEKDPYRLPVSIERVQRLMLNAGWEKPWIDQITDRIMKNMLRTTEDRCAAVMDFLSGIGLKQDEICNMASISVVLLGLNPETRLRPVVAYLEKRGVSAGAIPNLVLQHPRIFEYRWEDEDCPYLVKGRARIQVDVLPLGPNGAPVAAVNYFRDITHFLESPVSPAGPAPQ